MRYQFQSSFNRRFKSLTPLKQKLVFSAIEALKEFYLTNRLSPGLGLKNIRKNYWEIRASLKERVLFRLQEDTIYFVIVGNHDEIRKYLKNL